MKIKDNKKELAENYLKRAKENLNLAKDLLNKDKLVFEGYLLYYTCFYLMHALLLTKFEEIKNYPTSHGGTKHLFIKFFKEFKEFNKLIERTYQLRHDSDYKLVVNFEKEEVIELYNKALEFYDKVVKYLREKGFLDEKF